MSRLFKICLAIGCIVFTPSLAAQVLIANPQTPASELTRNSIRAIFAMRTPLWANGTPIQVFVLADDHPLHTAFCKDILGMFPYQLRRIWDRQVFSGTGIAPITVKSIKEMRERIAQTTGAIGYLELEQLDDSVIKIGDEL